jgi:ankyrin repeat protein
MKSIRVLCLFLAFMLIVAGCRKKPTGTITPLHQAAQAGDIDKVRILISEGANVNAKTKQGQTALDLAYDSH